MSRCIGEEQVLNPIRSGNQPARQAVIAETNAPEDRQDELEYLLSQLNTGA